MERGRGRDGEEEGEGPRSQQASGSEGDGGNRGDRGAAQVGTEFEWSSFTARPPVSARGRFPSLRCRLGCCELTDALCIENVYFFGGFAEGLRLPL